MFVVTPAGVIATDPIGYGHPQSVETYVAEIRKVTDKPIKYVIYSHHHFDHIAGGKPFKDAGASFIAHKKVKERLAVLKDPATVYNQFRPCILGYDTGCGANFAGGLRGLPTWNLDVTASKDIGIWKEGRVGATMLFQFSNVLNHTQLGDPGMDLSDPGNFGVLGGQVNTPRQMEFGIRIHF